MYEIDLRERLRWSDYSSKSPIIMKNKHVINLNIKNKDIVYWNIFKFI